MRNAGVLMAVRSCVAVEEGPTDGETVAVGSGASGASARVSTVPQIGSSPIIDRNASAPNKNITQSTPCLRREASEALDVDGNVSGSGCSASGWLATGIG